MKNYLSLPVIIFFILVSCQNSEKKTTDTDSSLTEVPDTIAIIPDSAEYTETVFYKFKNPDSNFIYFAANNGIFYLNEYTSAVDTVIKESNIVDFFVNTRNLYFVLEHNDDLYFYIADISGKNPQKIITVNKTDIVKENTMPGASPEETPEYYETKIIAAEDESVFFNVYYDTEVREGPYMPFFTLRYNLNTSEITKSNYFEDSLTVPFTSAQEEVAEELRYLPDTGIVYNGKIICPDTLVENNYYTELDYFAVSPDLTRAVWIVQTDWLEGPVFSYFIINLDGSGCASFLPYDDEFCWIDGNVLVFRNNSLKILPPDNQEVEVTDETVFRFMPKKQGADKIIISPYYTWG